MTQTVALFTGQAMTTGHEPFIRDGTPVGMRLVQELRPGASVPGLEISTPLSDGRPTCSG